MLYSRVSSGLADAEVLQSEFYKVNDIKSGKAIVSNMFSTLSNDYHAMQLKPIQKHYTLHALMDFEPLVDKTIDTFRQEIEKRSLVRESCAILAIGCCFVLHLPLP